MFRRCITLLLSTALWLAVPAAMAADDKILSPEDTVRRYLEALQDQDYDSAHGLVSKAMIGGKTKEAWVSDGKALAQFSEFKIFDYKVYPAKVEGEVAKVPNLLSSQDKFLNQLGVDEHEIYKLVKEDGRWKVDSQEVVVDNEGKEEWFPKSAAK